MCHWEPCPHRGKPKSPEHRAKISAAHKGRPKPRSPMTCHRCGADFMGVPTSKYCSRKCNKGANGGTFLHSEAFDGFDKSQCAICGRRDELVGDHHHGTGVARGVLCRTCNLAIGNMRDNASWLRRAADYLEDFENAET